MVSKIAKVLHTVRFDKIRDFVHENVSESVHVFDKSRPFTDSLSSNAQFHDTRNCIKMSNRRAARILIFEPQEEHSICYGQKMGKFCFMSSGL